MQKFNCQIAIDHTVEDLGPLKFFLGMEFLQEKANVQMSKSMYCKSILETFGTMDSIPVKIPCEPHFHDLLKQNTDSHVTQDSNTFRELVGSLFYLKVKLSPLACFAVTDRGDAHKRSRKSTRLYVLLTYQQALLFFGHTIKIHNLMDSQNHFYR